MTNQLTTTERGALERNEAIIRDGVKTFVQVGNALSEIRDDKLYRAKFDTFEDYCKVRWGMSRIHAHRMMESAEVMELLPIGNKPTTESQARELVPLKDKPDLLRSVVAEVAANSKRTGQPITATVMREAVRDTVRQMGRESQNTMRQVAEKLTPDVRETLSPENMRQEGELHRLITDLTKLPEPVAYAKKHGRFMGRPFVAEVEAHIEWVEAFYTQLVKEWI